MVSGFDHDQSGATGSVMQLVFPLPHLQLSFLDNLLLYDPFFQNPCSSPSSLGLSPLRSPLWELVRANGFDGDSHHLQQAEQLSAQSRIREEIGNILGALLNFELWK
jgi:hypothetical protein